MSDLTTVENVKSWLNISSGTDDQNIQRLITSTSEYIQSWLNRELLTQPYTETRDGTGGDTMVFADYPVTAVSLVQVGTTVYTLSPDGIQTGYVFDDGSVTLINGWFCTGKKNVKFAYTAGFAKVPPEIEQAVIEQIGLRYRERTRIGEASKSIAGEVVSFIQKDMTDSVKTILNNYRKVISL